MMNKINLLGIFFLGVLCAIQVPLPSFGRDSKELKNSPEVSVNILPSENSLLETPPPNPQCGTDVPYYIADLTGQPDGTWYSPSVSRVGNCCGTVHPDRCISFTVILDKNAVGLEFGISEGAIPSGSLFYQIDCGAQHVVGDGICLPGGQAYELTFCKPGANKNIYSIRSIPGIIVPDTVSTRANCPAYIRISGVDSTTVVWTDVTGGGAYSSYLSCTSGCLSNTVTPDSSSPSQILYEVCGAANDVTCGAIYTVCDTVVVNVFPEVEVSIAGDLSFCSDNPSTITASATPAFATYSYEWFNGYNASGSLVSSTDNFVPTATGSYSVVATDISSMLDCNSDTLNFDVTVFDCLPQCPTVSICPEDSVSFNSVSEFIAAGGITDFPCSVNDSSILLTNSISDGNSCPEIITQTYEIWDDCGNRATCNAIITKEDNIAPVMTAPPAIVNICDISEQPAYTNLTEFLVAGGTVNDNCLIDSTSFTLLSEVSTNNSCPATITRTYAILDKCGNQGTVDHQIIVNDTELPVLSGIPADITLECATVPDPPIIYTDITATDNCDTNVDITLSEVSTQTFDNSFTSVNYTVTRTWTAMDNCGNSVSETQVITVICEYCSNGIDDDGDGAIDETDSDCPCTAPNFRLTCENVQYYYIPPVWQMNTTINGGKDYTDPSSLVISTPFGSANVNIRTADGTSFVKTLTVTQGSAEVIPLSFNDIQTPNHNTVENDKGLIIESDQLIQVIYRLDAIYNKMLVTIKGEQALGQRFRTGSQTNVCGLPNTTKKENHFISVMAVEDNTTVDFEFTADMKDLGSMHSVILNAGETYLMIDDDKNQTITGSLVTSDKPIAVLSGSQHSRQCRGGHGLDAGVDQLIPTCGIGTDYVVTRGYDDESPSPANYAVIVGVTSNTEVYINGNSTPVITLNPGEFYTYDLPGPNYSRHYVKTSKPAYLYQFGSVQDNGEIGMALAAPIDGCRGDRFIEFFKYPNSITNNATVLIKNSGLSSLKLNGNPYSFYSSAKNIPGLPDWSAVTFDNSSIQDYNVIESDELFNASQFVGNVGSGTFGYLTSFKDKIFVYDPVTGLPTYNYFADSICAGSPYNHCINSSSCSGNQFITSIIGSPHTASYSFDPNSTCFEYVPSIGYNGMDTITVLLSDDFGFTQAVCISFHICGTLPVINGVTDSIATCSITEIPAYADFNAFLADGGTATDDCSGLDESSFRLASEISNGNTCPETVERVYEISNNCGLSSSFTQTIVIDNNNLPTASGIPNDTTVTCESVPAPPIIGTDITGISYCGLPTSITFNETRTDGSCANDYLLTREWTITDECGNSITESQVITVIDTIPPTASTPAPIAVQCLSDIPSPDISVITDETDNCTTSLTITFVTDVSDGNTCPETITRTYSITDECGNSTLINQSIIINDTISPSLNCPGDFAIDAGDPLPSPYANYSAFTSNGGFASDNCQIDESSFSLLNEVSNSNLTTRTYQIADMCGNIATCDQEITVNAPGLTTSNPPNEIVDCIDDVSNPISSWQEMLDKGGNATSTCGIDTTSFTIASSISDGNNCPEIITRTYEISDSCGNTISLSHQIIVDDNINPTINCLPDTIVYADSLIPPQITTFDEFILMGGTASDNCELDSTSFQLINEVTNTIGANDVITRTYQIADLCGNVATCDQMITVNVPGLTTSNPPNEIVDCIDDISNPISSWKEMLNKGGNATSTCGIDTTSFTIASSISDGNNCPEIITRTYEISDSCGNTISLSHQIIVDDNINPTINCLPDTIVYADSLTPPQITTFDEFILMGGTASDNCELDSTSFQLINEVTSTVGANDVTTRTYQIADLCGNVATCDHKITIADPNMTAVNPNDDLIECVDDLPDKFESLTDLIANGGLFASTCGVDTTSFIMVDESSDSNRCPEAITRTYEITDSCGNILSVQHNIIIDDITPPEINCPPEMNVNSVSEIPSVFANLTDFENAGGTVSDNCEISEISFNLVQEQSELDDCPMYIVRTYEIADSCGNTSQCEHRINIIDNEDPILISPNDTTMICVETWPPAYGNLTEFINAGGDASDNYKLDESSFNLISTDTTSNGNSIVLERTYGIKDICENQTTSIHRIISTDNVPPTAVCNFITVKLDENGQYELTESDIRKIADGSNDNCTDFDDLDLTVSESDFDCAQVNNLIKFTLTVTDLYGNSSTCEASLMVMDQFTPDITCKDTILYLDEYGHHKLSDPKELLADIYDNCGIDSIFISKDEFDCENVGSNTVGVTVIDANNNIASCNSNVIVMDTISPVVVTQNITLYLDDSEEASITPEQIDNGSSDACGIDKLTLSQYQFNCDDTGDNTVVLTVTDVNGNVSSGDATVTVIPVNEKPVAEDDTATTLVDNPVTIFVFHNDTDPDGVIDLLSITVISGPQNGSLSDGPNNGIIYTPDPSFYGDDYFTYSICDDGIPCYAMCDTATVRIHIPEPNNPPIAANDEYADGCFTLTGVLTDNDTDAEGNNLILNTTPILQPVHGTLTLHEYGQFTYDFELGTVARDSFIYEVCDDAFDSKCAQATVYITLFADNDCDGIDDIIDIDDDDDGILDVVEGDGELDSDGDGKPNSLDIDADGDGIIDNIEAQPEGHFIPPSGIDENQNGLDDIYEKTPMFGLTPVDTENDGIPDYLDLDTDDDGVPDIIEGFDIGGKGLALVEPESSDNDNDGLDNAFDSFDGRFNFGDLDNPFGSTATLQDFDDDGWRDWRDVDDDGDGIITRHEDLDNNGNFKDDDIDQDGHPEYLDTRDDCELFIPEGFSPNDDGVHDFFQIYCIDKYPNAKLLIFDRWGNKLYEHENYGNLDFWGSYEEAWWDGTTTRNPNKKVRAETHLYILETTPGSSERGFVMVSY